jgi:hypothetical protein
MRTCKGLRTVVSLVTLTSYGVQNYTQQSDYINMEYHGSTQVLSNFHEEGNAHIIRKTVSFFNVE